MGTILKPRPRLILNAALWLLYLEQELVYVGDEAIVEPSGETRRLGVDFGLRWQITDLIFTNFDLNYAFARSIEEPQGENRIPLAPNFTSSGALIFKKNNFNANLQYRWIADRPANEDNSIIAEGYFVTDLSANYFWKNLGIGFKIDNLFNTEWNETQFATESRLNFETESTEEIHFTPGTPFSIRANLSYEF